MRVCVFVPSPASVMTRRGMLTGEAVSNATFCVEADVIKWISCQKVSSGTTAHEGHQGSKLNLFGRMYVVFFYQ